MKRLARRLQRWSKDALAGRVRAFLDDPHEGVLEAVLGATRWVCPTVEWNFGDSRAVLVTSRRDIEEVLERNDVFTVKEYSARMRASSGEFVLGMGPGAQYLKEQRHVAQAVGKKNDCLRAFGKNAYRPGDLARIEGVIEESVRKAMSTVKSGDRGEIDIVQGLANKVPIELLERYFGLPDPSPGALLEWYQTIAFHTFNFFATGPRYADPASVAGERLHAHIAGVIAARRRSSARSDTVLDRLVDAFDRVGGGDEDIARTLAGATSGAVIPTIGHFLSAVNRLLKLGPVQRAELFHAAKSGDYDRVADYVREGARYYPYPPTIYRTCDNEHVLAEGTVRERRIAAGTLVVPVFIGAAFDPDFVHDPWRFIPGRPKREYLLFGHGQHECLGAHIGELMATRMAAALFSLPNLTRSPRRLEKRPLRGTVPETGYPSHFFVAYH